MNQLGHFNYRRLTFIPAWKIVYMNHVLQDEITHPAIPKRQQINDTYVCACLCDCDRDTKCSIVRQG